MWVWMCICNPRPHRVRVKNIGYYKFSAAGDIEVKIF